MYRSAALSVGLHAAAIVVMAIGMPVLTPSEPMEMIPVIPVELMTVAEETNTQLAGKAEPEQPTPEKASAPEAPVAPPPPPPPPPSKTPPPEKMPEPVPAAPTPPAPPPPAPRKPVEREPDRKLAEKPQVVEEAEKLAMVDRLPDPAPRPRSEPAPVEPPKVPEKPAAAPKPKPEETRKPMDFSRLAAKIDRLNKTAPEPPRETARPLSAIRIGEGGSSQNRLSQRLTVSEIDRVRALFAQNWNPNHGAPGIERMRVVVRMSLNPDGSLSGEPSVAEAFDAGQSAEVFRAFSDSVLRAVRRSMPLPLPKDKFDTWQELEVGFSLKELYG